MNGVDAVALATGNDWRAIEAGAHAFACRDGAYRPLTTLDASTTAHSSARSSCRWPSRRSVRSCRRIRASRLALRILGTPSARELAGIMAAVGLASNLAALRALVTDGIQAGHMALHARAVSHAAGARGAVAEAAPAAARRGWQREARAGAAAPDRDGQVGVIALTGQLSPRQRAR